MVSALSPGALSPTIRLARDVSSAVCLWGLMYRAASFVDDAPLVR